MTEVDDAKRRAAAAVETARDVLVRTSLAIHEDNELGFKEFQSSERLAAVLAEAGFRVEKPAYGLETAFKAEWGEGPLTLAYFCEYDALPQIGHACGHNLIATCGAGGAIGLKAALNPSQVRILVLGSPAEEGGSGKVKMINAGCLEGVDVALMAHPSAVDIDMPTMFGVARLDAEYRGKSAHASASPETGVNALDAFMLAYQGVAALRQHIRRDARIHGIITEGGAAPNIVPEYTAGRFYVRALHPGYLEELKERVLKCFEAGALASGAELSYVWADDSCDPVRNNKVLAGIYRKNAEALGRKFVDRARDISGGSTDMGNVSQLVPSIHPMFGIGGSSMNHTPEFTAEAAAPPAQEAMIDVAKALAMTGIDLVQQPELVEQATAELRGL
ncbi:MAG TPA: M20 family metallopeptidase [Dehalococcoidia bacterium]|nr:M20 family metallopeptidase [Dehalococcoidia bacterium]